MLIERVSPVLAARAILRLDTTEVSPSHVADFRFFLRHHRAWWLPITLLLLSACAALWLFGVDRVADL